MEIKVSKCGAWQVLAPVGRLDAQTAPELEGLCAAALKDGAAQVAVDLAALDYLSSAGLRVFLWTFRQLQARSGAFALLAPKPGVRGVLDLSGFATLFPIHGSAADLG